MAGLAGMMLTRTPVLRLPVRGKEESATTGRSVTGGEYSITVPRAGTAVMEGAAINFRQASDRTDLRDLHGSGTAQTSGRAPERSAFAWAP